MKNVRNTFDHQIFIMEVLRRKTSLVMPVSLHFLALSHIVVGRFCFWSSSFVGRFCFWSSSFVVVFKFGEVVFLLG